MKMRHLPDGTVEFEGSLEEILEAQKRVPVNPLLAQPQYIFIPIQPAQTIQFPTLLPPQCTCGQTGLLGSFCPIHGGMQVTCSPTGGIVIGGVPLNVCANNPMGLSINGEVGEVHVGTLHAPGCAGNIGPINHSSRVCSCPSDWQS